MSTRQVQNLIYIDTSTQSTKAKSINAKLVENNIQIHLLWLSISKPSMRVLGTHVIRAIDLFPKKEA